MYDAGLYTLVHRGTPGDGRAYAALCPPGTRVLELGCGDGRILTALAAQGCEVVGVDRDAAMLSCAEARLGRLSADVRARVTLIQADMRDVQLDRPFDRVIAPFNGLLCLLSVDDLYQCLTNARKHAHPGTLLALDVYAMDAAHRDALEAEDGADDETPDFVTSVEVDGTVFDVFEHTDWRPDEQRIDATYLHVPRGGRTDEQVRGVIQHRYLLLDELVAQLESGGWLPASVAGDFEGRPLTDDSEVIFVVAKVLHSG